MLQRDQCLLVFIDVQGVLAETVLERVRLFNRCELLLRAWRALDLPLLASEQRPDKLGPTSEPLRALLPEAPLAKTGFSCCTLPAFEERLRAAGRRQILLAGIETHICVTQTALHLLERGYEVFLVTDAVSARRACDHETACRRLCAVGVTPVTVEMALYELLGDAEDPAFRAIVKLVKQAG